MVGPFYGFFGLGLALYFASQGAGPAALAADRGLPSHGGGDRRRLAALRLTGSLTGLFACIGLGLMLHGTVLLIAIRAGAWDRGGKDFAPR